MTYKQQLIDLLKSDEQVKEAIYDSFYQCDYSLQERFIRMYCEFKGLDFNFSTHGGNTLMLLGDKDIPPFLDNTKDFDQQSEEIYKQIFLALTNLINE